MSRKWVWSDLIVRSQTNSFTAASLLRSNSLVLIFVALVVLFSLTSEHFLSTSNILLILLRLAPLSVVVAGQTLVVITGGIDLSVG